MNGFDRQGDGTLDSERPPFVIVPFEGPESRIKFEPTEQTNDGH
jgi:hypothetical protein